MLLHDYLKQSAHRSPDKVALVAQQQRLTYGSLYSSASGLASYLLAHGLQKSDRVAVYVDNCPEAVISIFGILQAGGCFVVVNHIAPPDVCAQVLAYNTLPS